MAVKRFDVDVGCPRMYGVLDHLVYEPHHRRAECHIAKMFDIVAGLGLFGFLPNRGRAALPRHTLDRCQNIFGRSDARNDFPLKRDSHCIDGLRVGWILHRKQYSVFHITQWIDFILAQKRGRYFRLRRLKASPIAFFNARNFVIVRDGTHDRLRLHA